jgi:mannose-6-phosphate isomerase-like protein (cupin superfamily)
MPPGGLRWVVVDLPPDKVTREHLATQPVPGMEKDGFHQTPTIDFVMILDGDLTLELDDGSVELHAGDCVVQQGTRHAWRNRSDRPVRMAVVVLSQHGVKPVDLSAGSGGGRQ